MKLNDIYVRCFNLDTSVSVYIFTSLKDFKKSRESKAVYKFIILDREDLGDYEAPCFKLAGFELGNPNKLAHKIYIYDPKFDVSKV